MPETIRYHLDEHIHGAIASGLRARGVDVTTTAEAGLRGATDQKQLEYAVTNGRVIFTQDADFLRIDHDGVTHPGIVYCKQGARSVGAMLRGLLLIW